MNLAFTNPFRPGAGHTPPYLAGRRTEEAEFRKLLDQRVVLDNMVLTGLRGVGKTVLLESLKPLAMREDWLWVGTDLSESASVSEETLAKRIITDLAVVTRNIYFGSSKQLTLGFTGKEEETDLMLGYDHLASVYGKEPGLVSDKLKAVFSYVAPFVRKSGKIGIVFAYDEAQNLADHADDKQYPLSILLEIFQYAQRKEIPFLLCLVGLPTLVTKLIEARTYAERMFRIVTLKRLSKEESKEAILQPVSDARCPVRFNEDSINLIIEDSGGYPYFIQFICREAYDAWLQKTSEGKMPSVPLQEIIRKLDNDFFAGRWSKVTERQQQLLYVIANLETANDEFTIKEIVDLGDKHLSKSFGKSQINQMLQTLILMGLIYKDRHGKYVFAVPMMAGFIKRNVESSKFSPAP